MQKQSCPLAHSCTSFIHLFCPCYSLCFLDSSPNTLSHHTQSEIRWQIGKSPVTGHMPIIRCLSNISCSVQSGVTVHTRGKFCNEEDLATFVSLFSMLGHCEEVEEKYMDAFTALTGSGLAFVSSLTCYRNSFLWVGMAPQIP